MSRSSSTNLCRSEDHFILKQYNSTVNLIDSSDPMINDISLKSGHSSRTGYKAIHEIKYVCGVYTYKSCRFIGCTSPISKSHNSRSRWTSSNRHASHFTIARSCAVVTLSIIVQYAYVNRTVTMKDRVQIVARDSPPSTDIFDLKETSRSHDSF